MFLFIGDEIAPHSSLRSNSFFDENFSTLHLSYNDDSPGRGEFQFCAAALSSLGLHHGSHLIAHIFDTEVTFISDHHVLEEGRMGCSKKSGDVPSGQTGRNRCSHDHGSHRGCPQLQSG